MAEQLAGILEGKGLDIDDLGLEAGRRNRRLALVDVIGTRCNQQHVHEFGILFVRADDFVIEADFFHRERDVLVRLDLHLTFQVTLGEAGGHLDDFGDRRVAADGDGDVGRFRAGALDGSADRLTDRFCVDYGFFTNRTGRRRLGGIGLDAVAFSALRQLDQLHRRGRDIKPQQGLRFLSEQHCFSLLSR